MLSSALVWPQSGDPTLDKKVLLLRGTPALVTNESSISTKTLKVGDVLPFTIGHDVRAGGLIVLTRGTPLTATVTRLEPPHRRSRGAKLELTFAPVPTLDGTPITLSFQAKGEASAAGAAGSIVYLTQGLGTPLAVALLLGSKGDQIEVEPHTHLLLFTPAVELDAERLRAVQPPRPTVGNAIVAVYREHDVQRARGVWCGHVKVRDLWPTQAVQFALAPGRYSFYTDYGKPLVYDLAPGDEIYLRMHTHEIALIREHSFLVPSSFEEYMRYSSGGKVGALRVLAPDGISQDPENHKAQRRLDAASAEDLHYIPEKWKEP